VSLRQRVARTLIGSLIVASACISVGLTASADGPFSIDVHPVFLRLDADSITDSRARALGLDVDIKVGTMHLHLGWSAIPLAALTPPSTKSTANPL
jgi:hypothetical protein